MNHRGAMLEPRRAAAVGIGAVDDERAVRVAARPSLQLEGVAVGREGAKALPGLGHTFEAAKGIGEVATPLMDVAAQPEPRPHDGVLHLVRVAVRVGVGVGVGVRVNSKPGGRPPTAERRKRQPPCPPE